MNRFEKITNWLDNTEHSFVNLISKLIPFLVPLIPAYVGYVHVTKDLGFHPFFGVTYGLVIEGLGYASIFKAVQFWENNRHYTKDENKAPLWLAVGIYVSYILVTLSVNVLLDWQSGVVWWKVLATGAISLLSIPAGLLMSISAVHTERVNYREHQKQERKLTKNLPETYQEPEKVTSNLPVSWRNLRDSLTPEQVKFIATNEPKDIVKSFSDSGYEITPRTASNWRVYAAKELGVRLQGENHE